MAGGEDAKPKEYEWVQEGKKWIKKYKEGVELPPLTPNSKTVPMQRFVAFAQYRVKDLQNAAFEKAWANRKSVIGTLDGFRFFSLMRRIALEDGHTYEHDVNYIAMSIWDARKDYEMWDEFGESHAGGSPFGIVSSAIKMAATQKQMAPIESEWEGILPVWPPWGRPLTWGSYYGPGGESMSAPGGWRHVKADGKVPVPADVFIVMNRVVANPGYEGHFEQWATAEGEARVRFAQHVNEPKVEIMGSSLQKFDWVKSGDKWIKRPKTDDSGVDAPPAQSSAGPVWEKPPPPWIADLGLKTAKKTPEPEVFDLNAMLEDLETEGVAEDVAEEAADATATDASQTGWDWLQQGAGGADEVVMKAAMGDAAAEAKEDHGFRGYLMLRRPGSPDEDPPGYTYISYSVWKDKASYKQFLEWETLDRVDHPRNPHFDAAEAAGEKTYFEGIFVVDATVQHNPPYPGMTGAVPGCERRRRLAALDVPFDGGSRLAVEGGSEIACPSGVCRDEQAWWDEWGQRLECWWITTPWKAAMQACYGALGVHIARRFKHFMHPRGPSLGQSEAAAEPGCEWVGQGEAQLELPDFPSLGGGLDFSLPPIPRLLPTWEHLQSLAPAADFEHTWFADLDFTPATTANAGASTELSRQDYVASVAAGTGAGVLMGVVFAFSIISAQRMRGSGGRLELRWASAPPKATAEAPAAQANLSTK